MSPFASASPRWQHAATSSSSPGPPDVSATPQARLLGWDARELADHRITTFGCFGFALDGYTDELAQVVLDRTEPFAIRAAGGVGPGGVASTPWQARGFTRVQTITFATPAGDPVTGVLAFDFRAGELQACFGTCIGPAGADSAACAEVIDAAEFTPAPEPPPPPSLGQRAALGLLEHPRPAAAGFVVLIALVVAALLFGRGTRPRA